MSSNIIRASTYILPEHTVLVKDEALLLELDPEDAQAFASMHVVQSKRVWERYKKEILLGIDVYKRQGYTLQYLTLPVVELIL